LVLGDQEVTILQRDCMDLDENLEGLDRWDFSFLECERLEPFVLFVAIVIKVQCRYSKDPEAPLAGGIRERFLGSRSTWAVQGVMN
jgi:hypothetical protein